MSGLCGWIGGGASTPSPDATLAAMAAALEAPADTESHAHAAPKAALHVRTPKRRGAFSAAGDVLVAIEGRPRWTRPDLAELGGRQGTAAALREAYRRYGRALLDHLRGPFALAVLDPRRDRALLAIDRMGIHRLCYAEVPGGLVFGTSAQSVRAHPAVSDAIAPQALFDFVSLFLCPAPTTIYRDQRKLLPAQVLAYERGSARCAFYWRMPYRTDVPAAFSDLAAELDQLLRQAVARCLDGEDRERLGAFLSGGLDSSTVAGIFSELAGGRVRTFTIGFDAEHYNEADYARIVARRFGTEHHEHILTPDECADLLPRMAAAYDEPFSNSSAVPTYYCARTARAAGVGCLLAGDGGDEIFAGNKRYVDQKIYEAYQHVPAVLRRGLIEPIVFGLPGAGRLPLVRRARTYIGRSNMPMPERLELGGPFRLVPAEQVFADDLLAEIDPRRTADHLREVYERTDTDDLVQRLLNFDLKFTLADNDLRKVCGMCALAGVEVLYPMLDDDLVEFTARIPPAVMLPGLKLRAFYKRAMAGWLPAPIIGKRKHGFGMPEGDWPYTEPRVRDLARDSLASLRRRGYVRPEVIDRVAPRAGAAAHDELRGLLWDLVMLELWLQAHAAPAALRVAS